MITKDEYEQIKVEIFNEIKVMQARLEPNFYNNTVEGNKSLAYSEGFLHCLWMMNRLLKLRLKI